ncbi:M24 family metallopeptidase [Hydrogenophaga sp.]|uniref:M24 family metallopeptidase n=1 Tax=Hydrogenophaga sp. TaxID=1904254 RepID=UPI00260A5FAE|nr:M24 family metallopeptidase [Hydrogenophaga sp.]
MRYAGKVNLAAIEAGFAIAQPGIRLHMIDKTIESCIRGAGCIPAFKNYRPDGMPLPFPATACISPNEVVVHGIPGDYVLQPGDLLTIDVGTEYEGWYVDAARTRLVPGTAPLDKITQGNRLIHATNEILEAQLSVVKDQCDFLSMIRATEEAARFHGVTIMPQWGGHGIGERVHLEPFIPSALNRGQSKIKLQLEEKKYARQKLTEGQTICIEPVVTFGSSDIIVDEDRWTIRQADGHLTAHTERCLLVTKDGYELLS